MCDNYIPKKYLLIEWPHSKRIIFHPEVIIINTLKKEPNNFNCLIPENIWELYKNSYYEEVDERTLVLIKDNIIE